MFTRRDFVFSGLAMGAGSCGSAGAADAFPAKPIKLMIPFSPGAFSDVFGRIVAAKMSEKLGVSIVIENRTGAGGALGAMAVAAAPADGYTVLQGNNGIFTILPQLKKDLPYDPWKDFTPISLTQATPQFLTINTSVFQARTFPEFRAEVEAMPADSPQRAYASPGLGTTQHLAMELLKYRTGMKLTHVAYRGAAPALVDLLAGRVPVMFNVFTDTIQYANQGKIRYIACSRNTRSLDLPDVPTFSEQGVVGYNAVGWQALAVRSGTPGPIIKTLFDAYATAVGDPAVLEKLRGIGAIPIVTSTSETLAHMRADFLQWKEVIAAAKITIDE